MSTIRRAIEGDASALRSIALDRCVSSGTDARSGLIDYRVPSIEKHERRIREGIVFVAQQPSGVVGFLDAYPADTLATLFPDDPLLALIQEREPRPFLYLNTIAVRRQAEARGVPVRLIRSLDEHVARDLPLWAVIVHAPLRNATSTTLAARLGFTLEAEAPAYGLVFGLYRRP